MDVTVVAGAFVVGGVISGLLVWFFLRKGIEDARRETKLECDVEAARLTERLTSASADVSTARSLVADAQRQLEDTTAEYNRLAIEIAGQKEQRASLERELENSKQRESTLSQKLDVASADITRATGRIAQLEAVLDAERKQTEEKLSLLEDAKNQLPIVFENVANQLLEQKSHAFTQQNAEILSPLRERLREFQARVDEVYVNETAARAALAEQVRQLTDLNRRVSQEAHDLTTALKGTTRTQGDWGEMILEKILNASGLREGVEYSSQETITDEDGSRSRPDVIVHLPDDKDFIIDSKVSLTAYQRYAAADSDEERAARQSEHLRSVKQHISDLSKKDYHKLYSLKSLDFVAMFVPIEPAYLTAIGHDSSLWEDAWKKNVLLVSPSTLLFVLRTVAHLWRREQQNRNAEEIANQAASLYDKFVGFVGDLNKVGAAIQSAKVSYDEAEKKLVTGRGSFVKQVEKLREMGAKPSKAIPDKLIEMADETPLSLAASVGDDKA